MAAGGPILASGTHAFVCTPVAMHGGTAPPLVAPGDATLTVLVHPGFARFGTDLDGRPHRIDGERFDIRVHPDKVRLVAFADGSGRGLRGLRARGLIADSPRLLARDAREKLRTQLHR
jgi:NAD kinase